MPSSVEAGGSAVMDTVQELRGRVVLLGSSILLPFFSPSWKLLKCIWTLALCQV